MTIRPGVFYYQCSCALLYYAVLAFDLWYMLLFRGGVKIRFLREGVMDALKLPIHKELFYCISVLLNNRNFFPI